MHIWESKKTKKLTYKARFSSQRDFIVQIAQLAKTQYEDLSKPNVSSSNPNFEENDGHENSGIALTDHHKSTVKRIYLRDRLVPPKKERVFMIERKNLFSNETFFLKIGLTQVLIAR